MFYLLHFICRNLYFPFCVFWGLCAQWMYVSVWSFCIRCNITVQFTTCAVWACCVVDNSAVYQRHVFRAKDVNHFRFYITRKLYINVFYVCIMTNAYFVVLSLTILFNFSLYLIDLRLVDKLLWFQLSDIVYVSYHRCTFRQLVITWNVFLMIPPNIISHSKQLFKD